jgi:hypothetical protein
VFFFAIWLSGTKNFSIQKITITIKSRSYHSPPSSSKKKKPKMPYPSILKTTTEKPNLPTIRTQIKRPTKPYKKIKNQP